MKKLTLLLSALFIAFTCVFAVEVSNRSELVNALNYGDENVKTIVLQADINMTNSVNLNKEKKITIDLNGHTIALTSETDKAPVFKQTTGEIIITNGTLSSNKFGIATTGGKLNLVAPLAINAPRSLDIREAGDVVVGTDVELTMTAEDCGIFIAGNLETESGNNPKLDFAGKVKAIGEAFAISGNGRDKQHPTIIIREGAVVESESDVAIYQPAAASMKIEGGTIKGTTAVYVKCGSVEITGGTLIATGAAVAYNFNGNGANATGDALVIDNCNYPAGVASVSVKGGEFESTNAAAVASYVGNGQTEEQIIKDFIEGGKFDGATVLAAELVKEDAEIEVKDVTISVDPTEWKTELFLLNSKAEGVKDFEITVTNALNDKINGRIQNVGSKFSWNEKKEIVKFVAEEVGTYQDTLILSATGTQEIKVPLEVVVKPALVPSLEVNPEKWEVELKLEAGKAAQAERAIVIKGKQLIEDLTVVIEGGEASKFKWDEDNQKVTFSTTVAGIFEDNLVVSSGELVKKVALKATVATPNPVLTVKPGEWKTSVELTNGKAEAERPFSINGKFLVSDISVAIKEADSKFAWNDDDQKVTFSATELGTYKATLVVSAEGAETVEVVLEVEVKEPTVPVGPVAVTGVTLNKTEASIQVGKTLTLVATVAPANADNKAVVWSSDKVEIATVADGVVTAVAEGIAVITVKTVDGNFTASCSITVTKEAPQPEGFVKVTNPADLKAGDKIIIANFAGDKAMSTEQTTYVENEVLKSAYRGETALDIANVSDAVEIIELVASGENFKLKAHDGFLYFDDAWMTAGSNGKKVNWLGTNETGSDFKFELLGDTIYVVEVANNGVILHNAQSTRFAHYARTSSLFVTGALSIYKLGGEAPVPVAVTGVTLDQKTAEIETGKKVTLVATIAPANASNKAVVWASTDEAVATVANGVVTGVAEGIAKISVKTVDGEFTDTCVVTVKKHEVPADATTGTLVTNPADIKAGDIIAIVNFAGDKAMSIEQTTVVDGETLKSAYRGETAFDKDEVSSEVEAIELVASGENFKLKTHDGFLYFDDAWMTAGSNGKKVNWLGTNETGSDFKFELSGDTIYVVEVANDGVILHNAQSTRFAHYAKTSTLYSTGALSIYKLTKPEAKVTTTLTVDPKAAEIEVGKTVTVKVTRDGNDELVWATSDAAIATVKNGVVTGVAEGVVKISATANNISDTCVVTVKAAAPVVIPEKTIAEFIDAKGGKCYLTGVVSNIKMDSKDPTKYNVFGNFDLTDASGTIYVYGLLTAAGESKKFQEMGVDNGDTLTVIAETYEYYKNETHEVKDAIFVSVKKEQSNIVPTTTLAIAPKTAEVEIGKTVTLKANRDGNDELVWATSDATIATVANGVVTGIAVGVVKISATANNISDTAVITVKEAAAPQNITFTKVTASLEDWTGQYLVVAEKSATEAYVFNGKDVVNGFESAAIAEGKITMPDTKCVVYIEKMEGGYSLRIGDNFVGGKVDANGITFAPEAILNTIQQVNGDSTIIISNNNALRFNDDVEQLRFRYYKNNSYGQRIVLFKSDEEIAPQPVWVPDTISVTEALAVCAEEKTHFVKGIVKSVITTPEQQAQYKNCDFMLGDMVNAADEIKCFRMKWMSADGDFTGNEIKVGDTLLVYGQTTIYVDKNNNNVPEIINGYVVELNGSGVTPGPKPTELDIDYAEAAYVEGEEGEPAMWMVYAGKYPANEEQEYLDYPNLVLYFDAYSQTHLAGVYDLYEGCTLWLSDNDSIVYVGGTVKIVCIEGGATEQTPAYFKFTASLLDAEGNTDVYSFETEVWAYDYWTGEDIILDDVTGDEAIENTFFEIDFNAPIYNIQGMQVGRGAQGILIQNGRKFIIVQ